MSPPGYIREAIRILKALGCIVEYVQNKHAKVYVTANGQEFIWTAALTPSDWRSTRNAFARLRRQLRECGVEPPPTALRRGHASADRFDELWALMAALPATDEAAED